jgi:hypothetical protein
VRRFSFHFGKRSEALLERLRNLQGRGVGRHGKAREQGSTKVIPNALHVNCRLPAHFDWR